jgi:hypothetical protein
MSRRARRGSACDQARDRESWHSNSAARRAKSRQITDAAPGRPRSPDLAALAGSFPGYLFTRPPIERPIARVGIGTGGGAHSKDELLVIEPAAGKRCVGLAGTVRFYVDSPYALAGAGPADP